MRRLEICGAAIDGGNLSAASVGAGVSVGSASGEKVRQQYPGGKRDAMNSDHFSRSRQRTMPLRNLEKGRPQLVIVRTKAQLGARTSGGSGTRP